MSQTHHPHGRSAAPAPASPERTPLRIRQDDLPGSPDAHRFIGADHGGLPISLFLVDDRPGAGPQLHRHPYPELFIVHAGRAEFELDRTRLAAAAGDIIIAPATTAHRFINTGNEQLHITAIHAAPIMDTQWLGPAQRTNGSPC